MPLHSQCSFRLTLSHFFPHLIILTFFLFTFLSQLPQSLSHSVGPSPPPPQSVLVESSPVAPPSFDQWQQQQQHPSDQSAAVEKNVNSVKAVNEKGRKKSLQQQQQ